MNQNAQFLATIDEPCRAAILQNIADRYGISPDQARAEVTDPAAEHLLDYLTEPVRRTTRALMLRHGLP